MLQHKLSSEDYTRVRPTRRASISRSGLRRATLREERAFAWMATAVGRSASAADVHRWSGLPCPVHRAHSELAALYVAGGLSAEEGAAAEAHLEEPKHDGCFEALRRASAGVEILARSLVPAQPGHHVWRGIEALLGVRASPRMAWRELLAWGIAAAAALLLIASLFMLRQARYRESQG